MSALKNPDLTRRELKGHLDRYRHKAVTGKGVHWNYLKDVLGELSEGQSPTHLLFRFTSQDEATGREAPEKTTKRMTGNWKPMQLESYVTNAFVFDKLTRMHSKVEVAAMLGTSSERVNQRCSAILDVLYHRALREERISVELAMALITFGRSRWVERYRARVREHFTPQEHYQIGLQARAELSRRKQQKD